SAGPRRCATAASFPPAMATSRTALRSLRGSIRWPPRRSRSYFGSAVAVPAASSHHSPAARRLIAGSGLPRGAALRGPAAGQVLAHVEGARHLVAGDLAREGVVERIAVLL